MATAADSARINILESRLAVLESELKALAGKVDKAETKLENLSERLVRVEEKINHLPTKGFIVTSTLVALTLVAGLTTFLSNVRFATGSNVPAGPATVGNPPGTPR